MAFPRIGDWPTYSRRRCCTGSTKFAIAAIGLSFVGIDPRLVLCQAANMGATHMSERRELYRSPNGDSWFLGREPADGRAFVIHQPNAPSGGRLSHIEVGDFLRERAGPEQQALLRLIGTLVEIPPYADRTEGLEAPR
jgi:hypothetical protein